MAFLRFHRQRLRRAALQMVRLVGIVFGGAPSPNAVFSSIDAVGSAADVSTAGVQQSKQQRQRSSPQSPQAETTSALKPFGCIELRHQCHVTKAETCVPLPHGRDR
jgi:hypothetical protein